MRFGALGVGRDGRRPRGRGGCHRCSGQDVLRRSTASCLFLTRNATWPSRSRWTRNVGKPRGLSFVGSEPADFPGSGDFRRGQPLSRNSRFPGRFGTLISGWVTGRIWGLPEADFRPFFNESRKPTKSERSPLAAFYVRLLREGRRLRQGDKLRDAPIPSHKPQAVRRRRVSRFRSRSRFSRIERGTACGPVTPSGMVLRSVDS